MRLSELARSWLKKHKRRLRIMGDQCTYYYEEVNPFCYDGSIIQQIRKAIQNPRPPMSETCKDCQLKKYLGCDCRSFVVDVAHDGVYHRVYQDQPSGYNLMWGLMEHLEEECLKR